MSNQADKIGTRRNLPDLGSVIPEARGWWQQTAELLGLTKPKALVVYALLLVSAGTLAYAALASRQAASSVRHTVEVRETTRQLLSLLADAETGQRGFLITRDEGYLGPYTAALPAVGGTLEHLRALIADNPSQLARFNRLPLLIEVRLAELAETVALGRAGRDEEAMAIIRRGGGKGRMDAIRSVVGDMVAEETRLLEAREVTWRMLGTTLLFSILACLVAAFTYALIQLRMPVGTIQPARGPDVTAGTEPIAASWPRIVGSATIVLGSLVLLGWLFDLRLLKSVLPGAVTMKANAGIPFILAGTVLVAARAGYVRLATACAGAVALIGGITLVEYFVVRGVGIDQLVFYDSEGRYPGRMAPAAAMAFLSLGIAMLMPSEASKVRLTLGLGVLLISLLAVLGYLYGFDALYRVAPYDGMAVHTAIGLALLASALLVEDTASRTVGWERVLRTPTTWLIAAIIGIIVLIGSATSHVITSGLMEPAPALAIATLISAPLIGSALWGSIDALDSARQRIAASERRLRLFVEGAPNAMLMVDTQGRITQLNAQAEKLFGYDPDELLGKSVEMLVPEQARAHHRVLRA